MHDTLYQGGGYMLTLIFFGLKIMFIVFTLNALYEIYRSIKGGK